MKALAVVLLSVFAVPILPCAASAQQKPVQNNQLKDSSHGDAIYVEHEGEDLVGIQFVFAFKELVRRSAGYHLVESREEALLDAQIVTLDDSVGEGKGKSSAISIVVTGASDFCTSLNLPVLIISHRLFDVGIDRVDQAAGGFLAFVDNDMAQFRKPLQLKVK